MFSSLCGWAMCSAGRSWATRSSSSAQWAIFWPLRCPVSLELGIISLVLSNLISIPIGLFCAAKQDSISDYTIRIIAVILMSIPMFWLATLVLFYPGAVVGLRAADGDLRQLL